MADTDKVVVTKSKLTAIADAIRSKNSTTDKMSLDSIPTIIADLKTGGDLSETTVELNLASGDQSVSAPAGTGYSKITISKPATLLPANIASGVEIAGVMGTANVAKPGGEPAVEYEGSDGIKISFSSNSQLTSLSFTSAFNGAIPNITDMSSMFSNCKTLTSLDLSNFDTSKVTSMNYMFSQCSALTSLDLSNFDTSKVTKMYYMFFFCRALTSLDLSNFDTSKVTSMSSMFSHCNALTSLNLSSFDTSNVTSMDSMFEYCSSLTSLDLSNFNTSNVTSMDSMFCGCSSLTSLNLSSFDTSKVTSMSSMFSHCNALTSLRFPSNKSFDISSTKLVHDGLVVLLNDLKSVTTTQTLKMGSSKLAFLSKAEKKIATNKGWTLA